MWTEYETTCIMLANPIRISCVFVCVSACAYICVHTLWNTLLNKNLWRHYSLFSLSFSISCFLFFYYFSCHWSLIFQRLKLFFFIFLLKQWHTANNVSKHTHTHAKHKELEDKRENMAHICVVLFGYKQTSSVRKK